MEKKGQVTIYIIIALAIGILGVGIHSFLGGEENIPSLESGQIKNYVENCIEKVGEEVIFMVGQGGGYYLPPSKSTNKRITYYLDEKNYMPSKERIELEISNYVAENLFICINNFKDFENYEIVEKGAYVESEILDDKIILSVTDPMSIRQGDYISTLKNFKVELETNFGVVYEGIKEIVLEQERTKSACLDCLMKFSEERNYKVNMFNEGQDTVVFKFSDKNELNKNSIIWIYANKN